MPYILVGSATSLQEEFSELSVKRSQSVNFAHFSKSIKGDIKND